MTSTFLFCSVEIFIVRNTYLLTSFDERVANWIVVPIGLRDIQYPVTAMKLIVILFVVFRFFEVWKHLIITPSVTSQRSPMIVIFLVTTDIGHGIGRTTTAQNFSTRMVKFSIL